MPRRRAAVAETPAKLIEAMMCYDWPGNVRERLGAVERVVLIGDSAIGEKFQSRAEQQEESPDERALRPDDLALSFRQAREWAVARWERAYM